MYTFDFSAFWEDSDYARKEYVGAPVTDEMIQSVQDELGYRLPKAYIELLRNQNGGIPSRTNHRTSQPTSWAEDQLPSLASTDLIEADRRQCAESSAVSFGWRSGDIRILGSILVIVLLP